MSTTFIIYPTTPAISIGRKARAAFMVSAFVHFLAAMAVLSGLLALFTVARWSEILLDRVTAIDFGTWYTAGAVLAVALAATRVARLATSKPAQYAAYALFVLMQGVVLAPVLALAAQAAPSAPACAATLALPGALAAAGIALRFREEYRMGAAMALWCVAAAALGGLCILLFGPGTATYAAAAAGLLAGLAVMYATQVVLEEYPRERYIAAALELFSAVPLFPWYLLRALFFPRR